ncbi:MAG: glycosyltransferase family 2 protein, partial [Chloroflexota bacterium]
MLQGTGAAAQDTSEPGRGGVIRFAPSGTVAAVNGTDAVSRDTPHTGGPAAQRQSERRDDGWDDGRADERLGRCLVSVVIPALNEAKNLRYVLPRIPAGVHEVLLVDGCSTDGTMEVARQLYPSIRLVTQEGKGKGAALRSGFAAARGEIIVMLDADGSTDPAEIPDFVAVLQAGADLAKGSRFLAGGGTADMSLLRRLGNGAFVALVRLLFGGRYSDLCYGYNAFR